MNTCLIKKQNESPAESHVYAKSRRSASEVHCGCDNKHVNCVAVAETLDFHLHLKEVMYLIAQNSFKGEGERLPVHFDLKG